MALILKNTENYSIDCVKMLIYGQAGGGKTYAGSTLPEPLFISAEAGLLSLAGKKVDYYEVTDINSLNEIFAWLKKSNEAQKYKSIVLNSISEIGEIVLATEKAKTKDGRQAYGNMQDTMRRVIWAFRDLPKHVYFTAKLEQKADELGQQIYCPALPGQKTGRDIPYAFDEVFAMINTRDENGNVQRALRCWPDLMWTAKDRSGCLNEWEPADLSAIIKKIMAKKEAVKTQVQKNTASAGK